MSSENNIMTVHMEPNARWESTELVEPSVLNESIRFPYACNVIAPNRLMKSAMSEQLATYDENDMTKSGIPTREMINLYEKFADGRFGAIVTGCIMVDGKNIEAPGNVIIDANLDTEERRNAFNKWTQCCKKNGSIIIAQLFHPGKYAANLSHKTEFDINRLTVKEINDLINEYAFAASYAQKCGFNGVEISCAYFFALGELITSSANTRTDQFGGSLENRSKILFKIIQAMRMKLRKPSSFVIGLKLFCGNFEPQFDDEQFGEFIHCVEKTGFDYITITGGNYNLLKNIECKDDPKKCEYFYQQFVLNVKKNLTRTKLFMNGGFLTVGDMCLAITNGWAAGIALGRPVASEPDLPKKILAGEVKGAVKSLFDPMDFSVAQQFAGTQLWQHGLLLNVLDPSNSEHVEQFKKDLHLHEKERKINGSMVVGYPKKILYPETMDEEVLNKIKKCCKPEEVLKNHLASSDEKPEDETRMIEEETHNIVKKQLKNEAPGDLEQNIVEDTLHKVVKRHESVENGSIEITEETIENVVCTQSNFIVPSHSENLDTVVSAKDNEFHDAKTVLDENLEFVKDVIKNVADEFDTEHKSSVSKDYSISDNVEQDENFETDYNVKADSNASEILRLDDHEIKVDTSLPEKKEESFGAKYESDNLSNISKNNLTGSTTPADIYQAKVDEHNEVNDSKTELGEVLKLEKSSDKDQKEGIHDQHKVHENSHNDEIIIGITSDKQSIVMGIAETAAHPLDNEKAVDASQNSTDKVADRKDLKYEGEEYLVDDNAIAEFNESNSDVINSEMTIPQLATQFDSKINDYFTDASDFHDTHETNIENQDYGLHDSVQHPCDFKHTVAEFPYEEFNEKSEFSYSKMFGSSSPGENGNTVVQEHYEKLSDPEYASATFPVPDNGQKFDEHDKNLEDSSKGSVDKPTDVKQDDTHEGGDKLPHTDKALSVKTHSHGLAGFISSTIPDSVQNLFSSKKSKAEEITGEKESTITEKVELVDQNGKNYEVHTKTTYTVEENLPVQETDDSIFGKLNEPHGFTTEKVEKTTKTTTTIVKEIGTSGDSNTEFTNDKKGTDDLDFEFVH